MLLLNILILLSNVAPIIDYMKGHRQRIEATLRITGFCLPKSHIDGVNWHLDVCSSHPGAEIGPKGWAVNWRKPKNYESLSKFNVNVLLHILHPLKRQLDLHVVNIVESVSSWIMPREFIENRFGKEL